MDHPGLLRGFAVGIDGMATTNTGSRDILVLGRDPEAMAMAANQVIRDQGGLVWIQDGKEKFHLPLPLLGIMVDLSIDELIERLELFIDELKQYGFSHLDPLFTMTFLSSTHLPYIRLTSEGIMQVKRRKWSILPAGYWSWYSGFEALKNAGGLLWMRPTSSLPKWRKIRIIKMAAAEDFRKSPLL